ncbi:NUDIX domain-containing protein [Acidaminobacter hydrogenoformans]|uniref:8-oxo-dGTP diphosphatase n=1 Tax=Acidaminobacter hydrogenoformans DSM 2784 TaxID=1120920 RepID=A0A1G5RUB1_9FIRM|nr:NUDIX domain-containing protein [Acidaminobacter hydrogenoformans]SCZ77586.1 8-oxo-dGTP diphosphatase [Acidaminobacter hydrogenoformans DSM 2784]
MKVFGTIEPHVNYIYRPGAYGLLTREDKVGIVKSPLGLFLIGGGIESGESEEDCLIREGFEEAGCALSVGDYLETVDEFVIVKGSLEAYHKRISAYRVEIMSCGHAQLESDHQLLWMDKAEAVASMYLRGQAYLIETYL